MKHILIYLLVLIFGIGIGYALNSFLRTPSTHLKPKRIIVNKIKKEIVQDTIIVEKIVHTIPQEIPNENNAALENNETIDSISITEEQRDDSSVEAEEDTNEVIIQEKLIGQRLTNLNITPIDSTDVEAILGVESDAFSKEIIIEFWQSPLDLTGYVLTRNKLKLFGFNPNETISLHLSKDKEHLFLNTETLSILLDKTEQFKNLALK